MATIPADADPEVVALLAQVYDDEGASFWLRAYSCVLGDVPMAMLARGDREPVLAEAQRLADL